MVDAQQHHHHRQNHHDYHPRIAVGQKCGLRRCAPCRKTVDEVAREVHKAAGHHYFGDIVEGALPTDIFALLGIGKGSHIHAVAGYIVGGAAESHDGKESDGHREEVGQHQREGHEPESHSGDDLGGDHIKFSGLEQLEEGAPERLEGPGEKDKRRPEGYHGIVDAEPLKHEHSSHVEYHKGKTHGEIGRGDPRYRADAPRGVFDRCRLGGSGVAAGSVFVHCLF